MDVGLDVAERERGVDFCWLVTKASYGPVWRSSGFRTGM